MFVRFPASRALLLSLALLGFVAPVRGQQTPPTTTTNTTAPIAKPAEALDKATKDEVLAALEDVITKRAFVPGVDLSKWPEFLAKQREDIDKAEKDADFAKAVNAAMREFGVSHIRFLTRRAAESRTQTSTIGVGIGTRLTDGTLVVTNVFPKSPAELAGLKQGDVITAVDGKKPDTTTNLQGEEGVELALKVKAKDGSEKEIKIKRERYSTVRPDTLTWVGDEAAVLKIHSFSKGYDRNEIEKLMGEAAKAKYLVLDLRSNGGGATNNLQHLMSLLMPSETVIGTFVNRRMVTTYADHHEGKIETDPVAIAKDSTVQFKTRKLGLDPFKGKVAVLINRGSASASEIAASALRENLGAPVVGVKSAGAVLASIFRPLPKGFQVQYPVSDYVTKNYVRLEKNPVEPDIEVTARPTETEDLAVQKAIEKLKG